MLAGLGRIRLRVGISTAFILIIIPMIGSMVGYIYRNNANLALATASESMTRTTRDIVDDVDLLLNPVARVIEATAVLVRTDPAGLRKTDGLRYFLEQIEKLPQVYAFYVGFGRDGAFYQVARLPPGAPFGPADRLPPEGARYVLRLLDASSGQMADTYIYLAKWGEVVGVERGPAKYDPRTRPWYQNAMESPDSRVSDVYTFASIKRPGLTVSHRVVTDDGVEIGVVAANITLDQVSQFLEQKRIGKEGRAFIIDGEDHLIAHPDPALAVRLVDGKVELHDARTISDSVVAWAVRTRDSGAGDTFTAAPNDSSGNYLVSFAPFPKEFNKNWAIGLAIQEDEFVGPLRAVSIRIFTIAVVITLLAVAAIFWMSYLLTKPLRQIIGETERIRRFDLDGKLTVRSKIVEIDELSRAVALMKVSLRNFGAYMPKDLVRSVVASGTAIKVGGERRKLTVMFTDIKEFTKHSESLPPEQVLTNLSEYFEDMSNAIHLYGGTIDKFIGDAIMAMWNAPDLDPDHAANACRAMLACRAASVMLDTRPAADRNIPVYTRFGLHCGEMMVGNVGCNVRMQYTVLGAAVNLSSRIEGLNKVYGTQLLVSGEVEAEVRGRFLFRFVDLVAPAGFSQPFTLFELVASLEPDSPQRATADESARCALWATATEAYRARDWATTLTRVQAYRDAYPDDKLAEVYIERCTRFCTTPPPDGWDGAERRLGK